MNSDFPDVVRFDLFKARILLKKHNIDIGNIIYQSVEGFPKNFIISQKNKEVDGKKFADLTVNGQNPINFLPEYFRKNDAQSGNFLERFLWITYSLLNDVNSSLDNIDMYFYPNEAPFDFLIWLASWFGIDYSPVISQDRFRMLVKNAFILYQLRGTSAGIKLYLEIVTGFTPAIKEGSFPVQDCTIKSESMINNYVNDSRNLKSKVTVQFPVAVSEIPEKMIEQIDKILKKEMPIGTDYYIAFTKPEVPVVDTSMNIGIDTI